MKMTGNRFEADVSPNKKFVDIRDRKLAGILTLLKLGDIQQIRDQVDRWMIEQSKKVGFTPFAVKLREKSTRHVIVGLNEEDGRELVELLDKLEDTMVPI